ncbi:SAR2788 family putative toxin [Sutcliffiella horikoshii]|uniref:SAR2788 family putative toxin n=1 Tax=Sutcliffiella horikoshii TaxID=79883 RepID=UPI0038509E88
MKNIFVNFLVTILILGFVLPNYSSAAENDKSLDDVEVVNASNKETENVESIKIDGAEEEDTINIKIDLETDKSSIDAEMVLDIEDTENNSVEIEIEDEKGIKTFKNYTVEILQLNGEEFVAKVIDEETMEETIIDSTKIQATIIPVIVGLIIRAGFQYAIKHYGKKLATQALIDLAIDKIVDSYGGEVKNAKTGKGKVITIPNKKQTIVIRLMEPGSGGRPDGYWRMSVGGKTINRAGNYSSNAAETHISLQDSSISTILKMIKKYKK